MNTNNFLSSFGDTTVMSLQTHVSTETALSDTKGNYYFVTGRKLERDYKGQHVNDHDILTNTSFFIDIDLQSELSKITDVTYSEDNFTEMGEWIKEFLTQSTNFKNWRYIVFSGNGLHVHFVGQEINTEKKTHQWKYGVKHYQKLWNDEVNDFFGKGIYQADPACCNLSRLRRLPGTFNQKNGRQCKVLHENNSTFDISTIIELGENEYLRVIEEERAIANKEREEMKKNMRVDEINIFESINSLPVELFVNYVVPQAIYDGKKNFRFQGQKNICGFFKTQHNRIANGGSHHFLPFMRNGREIQSYSVFDMIHVGILNNSDFNAKNISETILYFKENIYG